MTLEDLSNSLKGIARSPGVPKGAAPLGASILLGLRAHGDSGRLLLEGMLASPQRNERILAAQLLGQLNDPEAVPALARACRDPDFHVSSTASRALAFMERTEVVTALDTLADTPGNQGVQVNALFGLCRLNAPEGIKRATAYLESTTVSFDARVALAGSLAMVNEPHLLPLVDRARELFPRHRVLQSLVAEFYASIR